MLKKTIAFILVLTAIISVLVSCKTSSTGSYTSNNNGNTVSDKSKEKSNEVSDDDSESTSSQTSGNSDVSISAPVDPSEIKIRITYFTEETLDQYDSITEYADNIGTEDIIIVADEVKSDFSFMSIKWETVGAFEKANPSVDKILFSIDQLTPEKPLVIKKTNIPEIIQSDRGIKFTDKNGNERFYLIDYTGLSELEYFEFVNTK